MSTRLGVLNFPGARSVLEAQQQILRLLLRFGLVPATLVNFQRSSQVTERVLAVPVAKLSLGCGLDARHLEGMGSAVAKEGEEWRETTTEWKEQAAIVETSVGGTEAAVAVLTGFVFGVNSCSMEELLCIAQAAIVETSMGGTEAAVAAPTGFVFGVNSCSTEELLCIAQAAIVETSVGGTEAAVAATGFCVGGTEAAVAATGFCVGGTEAVAAPTGFCVGCKEAAVAATGFVLGLLVAVKTMIVTSLGMCKARKNAPGLVQNTNELGWQMTCKGAVVLGFGDSSGSSSDEVGPDRARAIDGKGNGLPPTSGGGIQDDVPLSGSGNNDDDDEGNARRNFSSRLGEEVYVLRRQLLICDICFLEGKLLRGVLNCIGKAVLVCDSCVSSQRLTEMRSSMNGEEFNVDPGKWRNAFCNRKMECLPLISDNVQQLLGLLFPRGRHLREHDGSCLFGTGGTVLIHVAQPWLLIEMLVASRDIKGRKDQVECCCCWEGGQRIISVSTEDLLSAFLICCYPGSLWARGAVMVDSSVTMARIELLYLDATKLFDSLGPSGTTSVAFRLELKQALSTTVLGPLVLFILARTTYFPSLDLGRIMDSLRASENILEAKKLVHHQFASLLSERDICLLSDLLVISNGWQRALRCPLDMRKDFSEFESVLHLGRTEFALLTQEDLSQLCRMQKSVQWTLGGVQFDLQHGRYSEVMTWGLAGKCLPQFMVTFVDLNAVGSVLERQREFEARIASLCAVLRSSDGPGGGSLLAYCVETRRGSKFVDIGDGKLHIHILMSVANASIDQLLLAIAGNLASQNVFVELHNTLLCRCTAFNGAHRHVSSCLSKVLVDSPAGSGTSCWFRFFGAAGQRSEKLCPEAPGVWDSDSIRVAMPTSSSPDGKWAGDQHCHVLFSLVSRVFGYKGDFKLHVGSVRDPVTAVLYLLKYISTGDIQDMREFHSVLGDLIRSREGEEMSAIGLLVSLSRRVHFSERLPVTDMLFTMRGEERFLADGVGSNPLLLKVSDGVQLVNWFRSTKRCFPVNALCNQEDCGCQHACGIESIDVAAWLVVATVEQLRSESGRRAFQFCAEAQTQQLANLTENGFFVESRESVKYPLASFLSRPGAVAIWTRVDSQRRGFSFDLGLHKTGVQNNRGVYDICRAFGGRTRLLTFLKEGVVSDPVLAVVQILRAALKRGIVEDRAGFVDTEMVIRIIGLILWAPRGHVREDREVWLMENKASHAATTDNVEGLLERIENGGPVLSAAQGFLSSVIAGMIVQAHISYEFQPEGEFVLLSELKGAAGHKTVLESQVNLQRDVFQDSSIGESLADNVKSILVPCGTPSFEEEESIQMWLNIDNKLLHESALKLKGLGTKADAELLAARKAHAVDSCSNSNRTGTVLGSCSSKDVYAMVDEWVTLECVQQLHSEQRIVCIATASELVRAFILSDKIRKASLKGIIVEGLPGSGKSHIVRALQKLAQMLVLLLDRPRKEALLCLCNDGIGARNIQGHTIDSAVVNGRNPRSTIASDLGAVRVIIFDEYLRIGQRKMSLVNTAFCSRVRGGNGKESVAFDGCVVLAVGNTSQLQPVQDKSLAVSVGVQKSTCLTLLGAQGAGGIFFGNSVDDNSSLLTSNRLVFQLQKQPRFERDTHFGAIVTRLACGEQTLEDALFFEDKTVSSLGALSAKQKYPLAFAPQNVYVLTSRHNEADAIGSMLVQQQAGHYTHFRLPGDVECFMSVRIGEQLEFTFPRGRLIVTRGQCTLIGWIMKENEGEEEKKQSRDSDEEEFDDEIEEEEEEDGASFWEDRETPPTMGDIVNQLPLCLLVSLHDISETLKQSFSHLFLCGSFGNVAYSLADCVVPVFQISDNAAFVKAKKGAGGLKTCFKIQYSSSGTALRKFGLTRTHVGTVQAKQGLGIDGTKHAVIVICRLTMPLNEFLVAVSRTTCAETLILVNFTVEWFLSLRPLAYCLSYLQKLHVQAHITMQRVMDEYFPVWQSVLCSSKQGTTWQFLEEVRNSIPELLDRASQKAEEARVKFQHALGARKSFFSVPLTLGAVESNEDEYFLSYHLAFNLVTGKENMIGTLLDCTGISKGHTLIWELLVSEEYRAVITLAVEAVWSRYTLNSSAGTQTGLGLLLFALYRLANDSYDKLHPDLAAHARADFDLNGNRKYLAVPTQAAKSFAKERFTLHQAIRKGFDSWPRRIDDKEHTLKALQDIYLDLHAAEEDNAIDEMMEISIESNPKKRLREQSEQEQLNAALLASLYQELSSSSENE